MSKPKPMTNQTKKKRSPETKVTEMAETKVTDSQTIENKTIDLLDRLERFWLAVTEHRWKSAVAATVGILVMLYPFVSPIAGAFLANYQLGRSLTNVPVLNISENFRKVSSEEKNKIKSIVKENSEKIEHGDKIDAEYLLKLGNIEYAAKEVTRAQRYYERGLELAIKQKNEVVEAAALVNLARLQLRKEPNRETLSKLLKDLEKARIIHRSNQLIAQEATDLTLIGRIHKGMNDLPLAMKYLQDALDLSKQDRAQTADIKFVMGEVYKAMGNKSEALKTLGEANKLHEEVADLMGQAKDLLATGVIYMNLDDRKEALRYFQKALKLSSEGKYEDGEAYAQHHIGKAHYDLGNSREALKSFRKAKDVGKIRNPKRQAENLLYIGAIYNEMGRSEAGIEHMNRALILGKESNNYSIQARALHDIGVAFKKVGRLHNALQHLEDARSTHNRDNDRIGEATDLGEIGMVQLKMGNIREAETSLQTAICISREDNESDIEAHALGYLALVRVKQRDWIPAKRLLWDSITIYSGTRNWKAKTRQFVHLANVYREQGELDKALHYALEAQRQYRADPDEVGEARLNVCLGLIYKSQGDSHKALKYLNAAHNIFQRNLGDRQEEAKVKTEIGILRYELNESGRPSLRELQAALQLHQQMGSRDGEALTSGYIGLMRMHEDDLDSALKYSGEALQLYQVIDDQRGIASMKKQIGIVQLKEQKPAQAEESLNKAREIYNRIGDHAGEASVLVYLGVASYRDGDSDRAMKYWEKSYKLATEVSSKENQTLNLTCQVVANFRKNEPDSVRKYFDDARRFGNKVISGITAETIVKLMLAVQKTPGKAESSDVGTNSCGQLCASDKGDPTEDGWPKSLTNALCASCKSKDYSGVAGTGALQKK